MSEWTVKSALDWTTEYLEGKGDENPLLSSQWLLGEATGLSRVQLYMNYDRPLSEDERGVLRDYVRRRGSGEPLQYITGEVAFRHITVKVRPGVLIPRPETEVLVSEVLAALPTPGPRDVAWNPEAAEQEREAVAAVKKALVEAGESVSPSENTESNETAEDVAVGGDFGRSSSAGMDETRKSLLVADLCTGSGCIACSLAYEHPDVRVIATDIASEAVALAKENAEALGSPIVWPCCSARWDPASARSAWAPSTPWFPTRPTCPPPSWPASRARWPTSSRRSLWTGAPMGSICSGLWPPGPPGP